MDGQDWTPVTARRRYSNKELIQKNGNSVEARDTDRNEKIRMAKLANADKPVPKKRITPESLQSLIRKRIEMKLSQEKADITCSFPRNTFKEIEANRLLPSEDFKSRIQQHLTIRLKIETV